MKHPDRKLPKASPSRPTRSGSTQTTRTALESLLGDLSPVAKRLQLRLEKIQATRRPKRAARELWNTFEDILVGQMALLAGISALLEIQVDVKRAIGEI